MNQTEKTNKTDLSNDTTGDKVTMLDNNNYKQGGDGLSTISYVLNTRGDQIPPMVLRKKE